MIGDPATNAAGLLAIGVEIITREAVYLDEQRWDEWLDLFAPDAEYWAPTWTADGRLAADPRTELSLMYFGDRGALEDRIVRMRTGRSPAALPLPRTTHLMSNILPTAPPDASRIRLRASWNCHAFYPLLNATHVFFGRSEYEIALSQGAWKIKRRKTILENDRIPVPIDVYCL